jgi:kynurenine formamidase
VDENPDLVRWQGWAAPAPPGRAWTDLSHVLNATVSRVAMFPAPSFSRFMSFPDDPLNVTEIRMVAHVGTHLDAPSHFIPDGPAIDQIPLGRLHGHGVVWPARRRVGETIGPDDLDGASPPARPGDMVLLDTGWSRWFGTAAYDDHPWLSEAAATWLADRQVSLVGMDLPTPDLPVPRRPAEGFGWPVHKILLSRGVLIVEHLAGLASLSGQRVEIIVGALNVEGADGAPARILARPLPEAPGGQVSK